VADRRSGGTSVESRLKTIAPTEPLHAVNASTVNASRATVGASGVNSNANPPPTSAPISTGRNPNRSPSAPPIVAATAPTSAARPMTIPIADAWPGPAGTSPSTISGWYGRVSWFARYVTK
jgi:hypothetical protein